MKNSEKTYRIQDREAGNIIETGMSISEAQNLLAKFEAKDKQDETYTPDFYEIVAENISDIIKELSN